MVKKNIFISLILFIAVIFITGESFNQEIEKDIHYFIQKGWENHSSIKQARFDIKKYKNMELEAISTYTPKVKGMTWLAPMYTISQTDDPYVTDVSFNSWGPYYSLDLQFQQPLFAFTRVISGIRAAKEGQKLAQADVEITKWNVANEIRLYYYGIVMASTMMKTVKMADEMLTQAINAAEVSLEEGKTDISIVELNQLKYYYTQIPINKSFINKSIEQAQEALELTTGERLEEKDIPYRLEIEEFEIKDYEYYEQLMFENRPLYKKLNHGINATRHLMNLEYKSMIPVLFAGGFLKFAAAPTVDMHENKYMSGAYNTFSSDGKRGVDAGFAVGFYIDFDPLKSVARALQKKAELDKYLELKNYAIAGFPVELFKTLKDLNDLKVKIDNTKIAIESSQAWMIFAANAYAIGDGKARDIMEGLAAFIKAKTDYYSAIYEYNKMIGELCSIVGVDITQ